jgi:hypothetical protein
LYRDMRYNEPLAHAGVRVLSYLGYKYNYQTTFRVA